MSEFAAATPYTVSAHMLYENTNPFILHEPGGYPVSEAHIPRLTKGLCGSMEVGGMTPGPTR